MPEEVASAFVERRAFEAALAETEMHRAANAALESQLGQAHADLLLAQADAETLAVAVRAWASTHQPMECEECEDLVTLARTAHPGQALADEVRAARAALEWVGLFADQLEAWGYATAAASLRAEILIGPVVLDDTYRVWALVKAGEE